MHIHFFSFTLESVNKRINEMNTCGFVVLHLIPCVMGRMRYRGQLNRVCKLPVIPTNELWLSKPTITLWWERSAHW